MKTASSLIAVAFLLAACSKPEPPAAPAVAEPAAVEPTAPAAVPPPTGPVTPSFDCAKAGSEAETMVCADYGLAALDKRLAEVYAAELAKPDAVKDLAARQRSWVKGRDECWKADDKKLCVEEEYRTRIAELQINSPGAMAASAVEFKCDDNSKPFTMAYYNDYDDRPAVITLGNDQAIVFPQGECGFLRHRPGMHANQGFGQPISWPAQGLLRSFRMPMAYRHRYPALVRSETI
ncbi:lysozyme inhibitor LprI family protein [Arenimonas sp. GDDSR-1]|uniref:lysozyme inhibitor LprI family protein n=1 Tax=Arenimonas sp. GDDSR-1 TaxID=2950125 RepID=UPI00262D7110|nr:lysozyme inhibitor LprI family protein [Arenimonas sp. GDDSR-1]